MSGAEALTLFEPEEHQWARRSCPVCRGPWNLPSRPETVTYAVQREGWVKIGKTAQLDVRLRILRLNGPNGAGMVSHPAAMDYGQPLLLLHTWPGDVEHPLHVRWRDRHAAGEWFLPDAAMAAWLRSVVAP